MAVLRNPELFYKKSKNEEHILKVQSLILLYSTKIFCFLVTIYYLWKSNGFNTASGLNQPSQLSPNFEMFDRFLRSINLRPYVYIFREEILPGNGCSYWLFVLLAILIVIITILGIIGILLDTPSLLIPYITYRWFFTTMLTGLFVISAIDLNSFVQLTLGFSYLPTFTGFINIFIFIASRINDSLIIGILEFCCVGFEFYLAYIVTQCYEKIINRKRVEYIQNCEERIRLAYEPPPYYQSMVI